jgi:hypothetical protein
MVNGEKQLKTDRIECQIDEIRIRDGFYITRARGDAQLSQS